MARDAIPPSDEIATAGEAITAYFPLVRGASDGEVLIHTGANDNQIVGVSLNGAKNGNRVLVRRYGIVEMVSGASGDTEDVTITKSVVSAALDGEIKDYDNGVSSGAVAHCIGWALETTDEAVGMVFVYPHERVVP